MYLNYIHSDIYLIWIFNQLTALIFILSFTLLGGLYWIKTKCLCWKCTSVFASMVYKSVRFFPECWSVWQISHSLSIFFSSLFFLHISWIVIYALAFFSDLLTQCLELLMGVWLPYDVIRCVVLVFFSPNFSTNFHMLP